MLCDAMRCDATLCGRLARYDQRLLACSMRQLAWLATISSTSPSGTLSIGARAAAVSAIGAYL